MCIRDRANFAPAPELTGHLVVGDSTKGIEFGPAIAAGNPFIPSRVGTTSDVTVSKAIVLHEKEFGF